MRLFVWLFRAFLFFTLFAFALNNQQPATVHWFFGVQWNAPMVFVVLVAVAGGAVIGVLAMLPSWWRHRRLAQRLPSPAVAARAGAPSGPPSAPVPVPEHPPREGL